MPVATFPIGPLHTNSYLLHGNSKAVAIDVGGDPDDMIRYLSKNNLQLDAICITHLHFDHLYGVAALAKATQAQVYAPKDDAPLAKTDACTGGIWGLPKVEPFTSADLDAGEKVFADLLCVVLKTPGHSPGSLSFYFPTEHLVFPGDALFYLSIGRTDLPFGNTEQLLHSIRTQLFTLPEDTRVCPGHGPETGIRQEKMNNPYCGDFA